MPVYFKRLHRDAKIPAFATIGSAGCDLHAVFDDNLQGLILEPGARILVSAGFAMELEPGTEAQIRSRSGLAMKHGVVVLNAPGTIDSDYRGEIGVLLINHGCENVTINAGDRIAQMVFAKVDIPQFEEVQELTDTHRGAGGFGSTGIKAGVTK